MSGQYFYKKSTAMGLMELGPYSLDEMRDHVRQSEIGQSHLVSDDGGHSWRPAKEFPDLFERRRPLGNGRGFGRVRTGKDDHPPVDDINLDLGPAVIDGSPHGSDHAPHKRSSKASPAKILAAIFAVLIVLVTTGGVLYWVAAPYRAAAVRRPQIDRALANIEIARKELADSLAAARSLQPDVGESEQQVRLREKHMVTIVASRLRDLTERYQAHLIATAFTSEFERAFVSGVPDLKKSIEEVQETAKQKGLELGDLLPEVNADTDRMKLLLNMYRLYTDQKLSLSQVQTQLTEP